MADVGRPCECGCGQVIPPAKLKAHPDQRFFSIGCGLKFRRAQPEFEQYRRMRQRRAMALDRLDRWGQPAYDRVQRICERRGEPLTREQRRILMVELAHVIRLSYRRGWNAARVTYQRRRLRGRAVASVPPGPPSD